MFARFPQCSAVSSICIAGFGLTALCRAAVAGDVLVVSSSGPFTTIQAAVDAAADYDTILVKPGAYASFTVSNRTLAIVGDVGDLPVVNGEARIQSTPPGGLTVIGRIDGRGVSADSYALHTGGNSGAVRIEGCTFRGMNGNGVLPAATGPGAYVGIDADTQFVACTVRGGEHNLIYFLPPTGSLAGSTALFARPFHLAPVWRPALQLFGCDLAGGHGGHVSKSEGWSGGGGGHGLEIVDGVVAVTACTIAGGFGASGDDDDGVFSCPSGGDGGAGGHGIVVGSNPPTSGALPVVRTRAGSFTGALGGAGGTGDCGNHGFHGANGSPVRVYSNGAWTQMPGTGRFLTGMPVTREGSSWSFRAAGAPGDRVYAEIAELDATTAPLVVGVAGHAPFGALRKVRGTYLGTVPPDGTLLGSLPIPALPPAVSSRWWTIETVFVDVGGIVQANNFFGAGGAVQGSNEFVLVVLDSSL